ITFDFILTDPSKDIIPISVPAANSSVCTTFIANGSDGPHGATTGATMSPASGAPISRTPVDGLEAGLWAYRFNRVGEGVYTFDVCGPGGDAGRSNNVSVDPSACG